MGLEKILVVDDQDEFLELLAVQLRRIGWEGIFARSGQEALEKVKEIRPTAILLDMQMPGMNGLELARLLRNDPDYRDVPILACSAYAMDRDRQRCLDAGCDNYLSKPFTIRELEDCILRLVSGKDRDPEESK